MQWSGRQDLVLGQKLSTFTLQFGEVSVSFAHIATSFGGILMSDGTDRREARRFTMTLPLRIFPRKNQNPELVTQTKDVSYQGLFFLSETNFQLGNEIDFIITLPQLVTQSGEVNIRCRGKIIRVESNSEGQMGVAAKIENYEFMPAASAA